MNKQIISIKHYNNSPFFRITFLRIVFLQRRGKEFEKR
jgi:hypothetical protein